LDLFQDKSDTLAKEHILKLIDEIHNNFKSHVLHHRGAKLTKNKDMLDKIFNAEIFGGEDANNLG
jgi:ClpP class serine protease